MHSLPKIRGDMDFKDYYDIIIILFLVGYAVIWGDFMELLYRLFL